MSSIHVFKKLSSFKGGRTDDTSEADDLGGLRITTFMIYMSHVKAGGHTIFPQAGISVPPKEGDALFWFNVAPDNKYDTRIWHLGCPVLYGNKWIANKWIKILAQYKEYPCWRNTSYFSTAKQ